MPGLPDVHVTELFHPPCSFKNYSEVLAGVFFRLSVGGVEHRLPGGQTWQRWGLGWLAGPELPAEQAKVPENGLCFIVGLMDFYFGVT